MANNDVSSIRVRMIWALENADYFVYFMEATCHYAPAINYPITDCE